jgi:hypothetical protein
MTESVKKNFFSNFFFFFKDLLNDDISDDVKCAKLIYRRHQFSAWYGWKSKCNGKALPNVSNC